MVVPGYPFHLTIISTQGLTYFENASDNDAGQRCLPTSRGFADFVCTETYPWTYVYSRQYVSCLLIASRIVEPDEVLIEVKKTGQSLSHGYPRLSDDIL